MQKALVRNALHYFRVRDDEFPPTAPRTTVYSPRPTVVELTKHEPHDFSASLTSGNNPGAHIRSTAIWWSLARSMLVSHRMVFTGYRGIRAILGGCAAPQGGVWFGAHFIRSLLRQNRARE